MLPHFLLSFCAQEETEMSKGKIQDGDNSIAKIKDDKDPHMDMDKFSG